MLLGWLPFSSQDEDDLLPYTQQKKQTLHSTKDHPTSPLSLGLQTTDHYKIENKKS